MKKVSILGGCASQLIAKNIPHVKAAGLTNWLSIASPLVNGSENVSDEFIGGLKLHNYDKRIMRLDLRKELLCFLTEKKADYLLINCNDCRLNVVVDDTKLEENERLRCLTYRDGLEDRYDEMLKLVDPNHKYKIKSCYDIDMRYYETAVNYVCNIIKKVYTDEEIILHTPNYVDGYVDDKGYHKFQRVRNTVNARTEEIVDFVQSKIIKNFPKCHVIRFPDNVLGDPKHFLGIHPLHYHHLYYEYGEEALHLIFKNHPDEIEMLKQLRERYSRKFEEEKAKLLVYQKVNYLESKVNFLMGNLISINEEFSIKLLKSIEDFSVYLDLLSNVYKKYIVGLAVRDTPGLYKDKVILKKLSKLGFKNYPNQLWKMYVGVIFCGATIYDCSADKPDVPVVFDMKMNELSIHLESHSYNMENKACIEINGVEYSLNRRGINLVVYDISKKRLIDSIAFDAHIMDVFSRALI